MRCYTMSSSPDKDDRFTVTVKRMPGGKMSNWMNDALAPGDRIEVMRPNGLFVLRAAEVPIVAFAGGSGITPVLSIIKTALATTTREIALVYANRSAGERHLRALNSNVCARHPTGDSRCIIISTRNAGSSTLQRARHWSGSGRTPIFYVCGPAPYMEAVEAGLERRGIDRSQVCIERFELPDGRAHDQRKLASRNRS